MDATATDDELVHPDAPQWFRDALAVPFAEATVDVDGCPIHYLMWGEVGRRGLVFVHGGGAHAHWWTHVAARFATEYRVVALDLSGHGDSGRRSRYSMELWVQEVMGVGAAAGIEGAPVVVGHSMGGFVTIAAGALRGDELAGAVVCDSPVNEPDPEIDAARAGAAFGRVKVYPTREEALGRFRTVPPQDRYLDYVMHHVARRSVHAVDGGWSWKFDPDIFTDFAGHPRVSARPYLERLRCRFALLRSEFGLVTPGIGAYMYDLLGRNAPVVELPEAGHHAMLDEPLSLLTALRTLLADWEHSLPRRRPGIVVRQAALDGPVAAELIASLNAELAAQYPEEGANHFRLDGAEVAPGQGAFVVAWDGSTPVGCGAVRLLDDGRAEIKRMFVPPEHRGRGVARLVLAALEERAAELGVTTLVLETGTRQHAAQALYRSAGFHDVACWGEYAGAPLSQCMAKELI
jgi:pimeloyl-ACP methyl ester carboxylesterase/GNAT superfamily N-acetyltransferase